MLAEAGADRDDAAVCGSQPQRGVQGGDQAPGAGPYADLDQPDGGVRGDGVHKLGVLDLLAGRQPRGDRADQAAVDQQPRGGQPEEAVEPGHILAEVSDHLLGLLRSILDQNDGLAASADPAIEQRLDAVGDLELPRGVARRRGQAVRRRLQGRVLRRLHRHAADRRPAGARPAGTRPAGARAAGARAAPAGQDDRGCRHGPGPERARTRPGRPAAAVPRVICHSPAWYPPRICERAHRGTATGPQAGRA